MTDPQHLIQSLFSFSLFKGLEKDPKELAPLAGLLKHEVFQSRDFIIHEKNGNNRLYFVLSGDVVINKVGENGQIVVIGKTNGTLHPFFGESALLGKTTKSANVVAHTQCECLSVSAQEFLGFLASSPLVASIIYRNMAGVLFDRLSKANRDLLILGLS